MRNPRNDPSKLEDSVRPERRPTAEVEGRLAPRSEKRPSTSLRTSENSDRHHPERTCVLTRRKADKDQLIRLALGPDGSVAADVRARAPRRGAWISVDKAALHEAVGNGKLKAALQRAFKTGDVTVPADLAERAEAALRQYALDRLGMEARSGNLITGSERVETAARSGKVHLLIHAADSGADGRARLDQAWRVGGGGPKGVIFPEGRTILSLALGRENVVHIALIEPAAAARVSHALARWRDFIDPDAGLEGGDPPDGIGSAEEVEGSE
jgi:predicted RNA-binding protein YlxR (DUF448 family)